MGVLLVGEGVRLARQGIRIRGGGCLYGDARGAVE
jgi:hypothetical protein